MKRIISICLIILMIVSFVSCGIAEEKENLIYTPEDDYETKYGYELSLGHEHIQTGYIPKSEYKGYNEKISYPSDKEKPTFKKDGVEYVLVYSSSRIAQYEDYIVDEYFAYNPNTDDVNEVRQKSYSLYYLRDSGKLVGMGTPLTRTHSDDKCYLGEMEDEDVTYTQDELTEFAKEMAKKYVKKFGLDMKVDECVLIYEDVKGSMDKYGDRYYFHKCLDGIPTGEYVRVDVSSNGKCWGVQSAGIGMYDEFANAKIDIEAIKSGISNPKMITLLNDMGTLIAEIKFDVYVQYSLEDQDLGYPEAGYETRTKYVPLVAKEIETE